MKEDNFLAALKVVGCATKYNFQPFTAKSNNVKNSLQYPTNILNNLFQDGMVKVVPLYPLPQNKPQRKFYYDRKHTFYTLRGRDGYRGKIARSHIDHTSGLRDIALAFYYSYPDLMMSIKYEPRFGKYNPDAHIKLTTVEGKEYDFIIEFERTTFPNQIRKEKVSKALRTDFKKFGLSYHTKILFVYTLEAFDVYSRPIEYDPYIIENITKHTERLARTVNSPIFRFLPYHDFINLDKDVWFTGNGQKVKLIN